MNSSNRISASVEIEHPLIKTIGAWKIPLAAWMVTAVFILSNSATPLYVSWQKELAFSSGTLSVIFAAYIAGLLIALLVAGQLSDRWGRKPVLVPGILVAMSACMLFAAATSISVLILARFLTGVAVGTIVSAGMAMVVDVGGAARKRQASLAASVAMVLGAGLGPMLSGLTATLTESPIIIVFSVEFILLSTALLILVLMPLPSLHHTREELREVRLRLPSVKREHRRDIFLGIAVFGPGITATSFVLSLGPSLLSGLLHVQSPLISGGAACLMFFTAAGVQFAVKRLSIRTIFLFGLAGTGLSMIAMGVAVYESIASLLILAALMAGVGQGLGQLAGLTLIATKIENKHRAKANSLLNIGGYIPAGILPVATGYLIDVTGLAAGAVLFTLLMFTVAAFASFYVATTLPKIH